jgi:hypothetical protein
LNDAQREEFQRLIEADNAESARSLALWRLGDLQLTLRLSEMQTPAVLATLTESTLTAITQLWRDEISDFSALLSRLDAIGAREHAELSRALTPEQLLRFQEQTQLRRRALDFLLEPEAARR